MPHFLYEAINNLQLTSDNMRFLPHTEDDRNEMLAAIGVDSIDDLYDNVANNCQLGADIELPTTKPEFVVEQIITSMAEQNMHAGKAPCFLGAGCYWHHIPAAVDHIIQRSEFLTAYTPYQPEISQGTLAVIFEFQSMIAALTGQEIANASMYDGATAVAEAALMARRITKRDNVHIVGALHPDYKDTIATYMEATSGSIMEDGELNNNSACLIVQTPDFYGNIHNLTQYRKQCDKVGAKLIVAITEIVSLGLLPPPEEADIVAGEGQSIGVAMQYGGPHLGFFACSMKDVRQMPGRLCGITTDKQGKRSFVLTLNTREQHIRRAKATSNICTNVGLCATAFTIHLSLLGEEGFKQLAQINHENACILADKLETIGCRIENEKFFNEFVVNLPTSATAISRKLYEKGIISGLVLDENRMLVTATEMTNIADIENFAAVIKECM